MNHDPFCNYRPEKWHGWMQVDREIPCTCDFINKIRIDENKSYYSMINEIHEIKQELKIVRAQRDLLARRSGLEIPKVNGKEHM